MVSHQAPVTKIEAELSSPLHLDLRNVSRWERIAAVTQ